MKDIIVCRTTWFGDGSEGYREKMAGCRASIQERRVVSEGRDVGWGENCRCRSYRCLLSSDAGCSCLAYLIHPPTVADRTSRKNTVHCPVSTSSLCFQSHNLVFEGCRLFLSEPFPGGPLPWCAASKGIFEPTEYHNCIRNDIKTTTMLGLGAYESSDEEPEPRQASPKVCT